MTRHHVRLTEREIRGLLALCPRCRECRARAELELNGRPLCVPCGAKYRRGRASSPAWADAADVLEVALSPHEVSTT